MKRKYSLGGMALIALMLSSAMLVSAAEITIPSLYVAGTGSKWHFSLMDPNGGTYFSFADIQQNTIHGYVIIGSGYTEITPVRITFDEKSQIVTLHFSQKDLPKSSATVMVGGQLISGDSFSASGPGWMWRSGGG